MASDAYIAGISALIGVAVTGGVQTGLAVRSDRRVRRRAVRLLAKEMTTLSQRLRSAEQEPAHRLVFLKHLPRASVYPALHDELAETLSDGDWEAVTFAYLIYDTLQDVAVPVEGLEYRPMEAHSSLAAAWYFDEAVIAVASWRTKRKLRRSHCDRDASAAGGGQ